MPPPPAYACAGKRETAKAVQLRKRGLGCLPPFGKGCGIEIVEIVASPYAKQSARRGRRAFRDGVKVGDRRDDAEVHLRHGKVLDSPCSGCTKEDCEWSHRPRIIKKYLQEKAAEDDD